MSLDRSDKLQNKNLSAESTDLWKIFSHANSKPAGSSRMKTIVFFMVFYDNFDYSKLNLFHLVDKQNHLLPAVTYSRYLDHLQ